MKAGSEPGGVPGVGKKLAFIEGTITLVELNQRAGAHAENPGAADRDSHVMARLIRVLYTAYGEQFLSPLLTVLKSSTATVQEVNDVVMGVALSSAAAGSTGGGRRRRPNASLTDGRRRRVVHRVEASRPAQAVCSFPDMGSPDTERGLGP